MSLDEKGFHTATASLGRLTRRTNKLFKKLKMPLKNKVQMSHHGFCFLFGQEIGEDATNDELVKIIQDAPGEDYDGHIDMFGGWHTEAGEKREFEENLKKAESGDTQAMQRLSQHFYPDQMERVIYWDEKAAKLGDIGAMRSLISLYQDDPRVEKDVERVKYWYEYMLENGGAAGEDEALVYLTYNYRFGKNGFPKDLTKAYEYETRLNKLRSEPLQTYEEFATATKRVEGDGFGLSDGCENDENYYRQLYEKDMEAYKALLEKIEKGEA